MARNRTLVSLLTDYRLEIRASGNPAHNSSARDAQVKALQDTQEWLWRKHDWPFLRVRRLVRLQAGQRYYDPRGAVNEAREDAADLGWERLERVEIRYNDDWCELETGISEGHYSTRDSDLDEREWPAQRWQHAEEEQIELWPIPAVTGPALVPETVPASLEGTMRLNGIRDLHLLVADDDRADLDHNLIIWFAAAEELASQGSKRAQLVLDKAMSLERNLTGNLTKRKSFSFGGSAPKGRELRGPPRVHYRVNEPGV